MTTQTSLRLCAVLALAMLIPGCQKSDPTATVDGRVTYNGNAVPKGSSIVFLHKDKGTTMTFEIGDDGAYSIGSGAKLPVGTYAVAVTAPGEKGVDANNDNYNNMMKGTDATKASKKEAKSKFPVPAKFQSVGSSGKTVEVEEGSQEINIDFK